MASIRNLKQKILELKTLADNYAIALSEDKDNFSINLLYKNISTQIEELQQILYQENIKREKEIVELRLIGRIARQGTFPLSLVGGITDSFSEAITSASKHVQFGKKGGKKVDQIINQTIDLRLEGIGRGSTIFYLSANTSPDLFGNSTIQSSLENTFSLLNSINSENLLESVPLIGTSSIKYFSDFFKELNQDDLELNLKWHSPKEEVKIWNGTKKRILELYNSLNLLKVAEPEEIYFTGEIITLSLKGKFEILSDEKVRFYGMYQSSLSEVMQELHIGQRCSGQILKEIVTNPITGKEKYEYTLVTIEGE